MAGAFNSNGEDEIFSGINIAPLVDVVLVLLIIFMITAPAIYQSAIKVSLPKASTGESSQKSPLSFTLTQNGELSWNGEKVDWDTLGKRLAGLGEAAQKEPAMVSADTATPHGTVVRLMDALRQAGIYRFALNVESTKR